MKIENFTYHHLNFYKNTMVLTGNIIVDKSYLFAVRIVKLYKFLYQNFKESTLSKQILRCGTSIGANVAESQNAQSYPDFISKLNIALKETDETKFWINLLYDTEYIDESQFQSLSSDVEEISKLLTSIIISSKDKQRKQTDK